jgi:RNA polymerase sigma factor (sigma-70 family)
MLVEQHAPSVYRLAAAIVGEADAQDVTQETFVAAWSQISRLRRTDAFAAWLRRICVNRSRNHLRSRGRTSISLDVAGAEYLPSGARDFRDAIHARAILEPAYEQLSPDQRIVLSLHYATGLSISETAAAMGVRPGTAKSRLNAALGVLRRAIDVPITTKPNEAQVAR